MQREEIEVTRVEGTVGRNLKQKEVALRYRLKMVAFTQTVAGEAAAARVVKWLRGITATSGVMLSQEESHVGRMMQKVGSTLWYGVDRVRDNRDKEGFT